MTGEIIKYERYDRREPRDPQSRPKSDIRRFCRCRWRDRFAADRLCFGGDARRCWGLAFAIIRGGRDRGLGRDHADKAAKEIVRHFARDRIDEARTDLSEL